MYECSVLSWLILGSTRLGSICAVSIPSDSKTAITLSLARSPASYVRRAARDYWYHTVIQQSAAASSMTEPMLYVKLHY
jgi:hypothetical protein